METYKEIEGDLIALARIGTFDVIAQGVNCWCRQKSGLAPQMVKAFGTDTFLLEKPSFSGDIDKLGRIDYKEFRLSAEHSPKTSFLTVVNCYTQFKIKKFNEYDYEYTTEKPTDNPFDYAAFTLCMRKMNLKFAGKRIGLPVIGGHLAGGNPIIIKEIIQKEFTQCDVTVVIYKP